MPINALTRGVQARIASGDAIAARFAGWALSAIHQDVEPTFAIGRPTAERQAITYEDGGRTIVLPLPAGSHKLYAAINETGGVTVMLAEEY